jgi:hypothetical protein
MQNQVQQNWGAVRNLAPTERRIDPLTFITSSLLMRALVFVAVLWSLWHPIPFIGLPRGSFVSTDRWPSRSPCEIHAKPATASRT